MTTQNSNTVDYLHASVRIGSCKGPISYGHSQTVFHSDDIPKSNRLRKQDVLEWKKSKILSTNRSDWNKSTDPNVPVCERRTMENFVHDRSKKYVYNYRAESLDPLRNKPPIDAPTKFHVSRQLESEASDIRKERKDNLLASGYHHRTREVPVHEALADAPGWNVSTFITPKDISDSQDKLTTKALTMTQKKNSKLGKTMKYLSPMETTIAFQEKVRQQKKEGTFSTTMPVYRPVTEPVVPFDYKNHEAVEKSKKYYTDKHSGVWQYNDCEKRYDLQI